MQINSMKVPFCLAIVALYCCCLFSLCAAAAAAGTTTQNKNSNSTINSNLKLKETLDSMDECVTKSVFSFVYPLSYPPTSVQALRDINCKNQAEGFKCLKEKSKTLPAILKRGIQTFLSSRQRHHRKYCSGNVLTSEQSKEFVASMKCVLEKRFDTMKRIDSRFSNSLLSIRDQNYNDSTLELKYLCCSIVKYKVDYIDGIGQECSASKSMFDELLASTIPSDLNLICEDEEKLLTKICPGLKPLNVSDNFVGSKGDSPSVVSLYLIATLGEKD